MRMHASYRVFLLLFERERVGGEEGGLVEAAREAGGREVVKVPLQWPPKSAQNLTGQGKEELGAVVVQLKP